MSNIRNIKYANVYSAWSGSLQKESISFLIAAFNLASNIETASELLTQLQCRGHFTRNHVKRSLDALEGTGVEKSDWYNLALDYHYEYLDKDGKKTESGSVSSMAAFVGSTKSTYIIIEKEKPQTKTTSSNLTSSLQNTTAQTSTNECKICLSGEVTHMYTLCNHVCVCESCSKRIAKCPICRTVGPTKRVYLS